VPNTQRHSVLVLTGEEVGAPKRTLAWTCPNSFQVHLERRDVGETRWRRRIAAT